MRLIIGQQNPYSYTFTPGNGKLVINGILNYTVNLNNPACLGSIVSIYDVTAGISLPLNDPSQNVPLNNPVVSIAKTTNTTTGAQTFTLTWKTLPGGLTNGDTLLIKVNCGKAWATYALQQYQKA